MKLTSIILSLFLSINFWGDSNLPFEVRKVYEPLSISEAELANAKTIQDLNQHFDPSWVRTYIGVKITSVIEGEQVVVEGQNNVLNPQQLNLLNKADKGSPVKIEIEYLPENSLKSNEPKNFTFSFSSYPDFPATFSAGKSEMIETLKSTAIDKIPLGVIEGYGIAAVNFTIDDSGHLVNAAIVESSRNAEVDKMLLKAVCSLDEWEPARYSDGSTTSETYVMIVGNMESCTVNLLNVRS